MAENNDPPRFLPPRNNNHRLRQNEMEVDDDVALIPEHLRLEDFETWLANNALRYHHHDDDDDDDDQHSMSLDRQEALDRFQEHCEYQKKLHAQFFGQNNPSSSSVDQERFETLKRFESQQFRFIVGGVLEEESGENNPDSSPERSSTTTTFVEAPLRLLAESCETIYVAAARHNCTHLSLRNEYSIDAVYHVIAILQNQVTVESTPDDLVIDCCRLVHYLQNEVLLDQYATMLLNSVDTSNCLSLSQLADQLSLPTLLERSLSHMMDSLDQVQEQIPHLLTQELRDRISAIQTAIQSSIHQSQRSKLYFSSLNEYLAIFAERVQYYRERLQSAQEQRDELLQAIHDEQDNNASNRGRFVISASSIRYRSDHLSEQYVQDLQHKIERQEQRVRTLEIALEEQKKLFGNKNRLS